jgi:hypothetical protein
MILTTKTRLVMLSEAKHLVAHQETLRFTQGDTTFPILLVKIHDHVLHLLAYHSLGLSLF